MSVLSSPHARECRIHRTPVTAGQDATEAFFGLHRHEVLERPQYARLQIGFIDGEEPEIEGGRMPGKISKVPYAEPSWLAEGYYSPYYKEVRFLSLRASEKPEEGAMEAKTHARWTEP